MMQLFFMFRIKEKKIAFSGLPVKNTKLSRIMQLPLL